MNIREVIRTMSLEQKCYLLSGKDSWHTRAVEQLEIPSCTLAEGPHGVCKEKAEQASVDFQNFEPATCFPTAAAMANSWNVELGEQIGKYLGEEAASQGVHVLLGPGLNIKRNPLCGRNFESFSEDPYLSGKMAAAYVRGIQSKGVAACLRHFAVNSQETRRVSTDSIVDERTLRELYLTGFEIAVKEGGAKAVMAAGNRVNGTYANENRHLLTQILRNEWGFDGFVMSGRGESNLHTAGLIAGSNLEMPGTGGDSQEALIKAVRRGEISEKVVDLRVRELLEILIPAREAVKKSAGTPFSMTEHHLAARIAAEESIVLLKNDSGILPLKKWTRLAVIGRFAEEPRIQGIGASRVEPTKLDSTSELVKNYFPKCTGYVPGYQRNGAPDGILESEALELAKRSEAVLLFLGLDDCQEMEGCDRRHMRLAERQLRLLRKLARVNPHILVVLNGGAPVEMGWEEHCEAIVYGSLSGQAGAEAMLRILAGEVTPSGKLSETFPFFYRDVPSAGYFPGKERNAEYRESLYVGYRYYTTVKKPVRYPFGYGLSYTSFEYADLQAEQGKVSFLLKNTGKREGAEIAQLYISPKVHGVFRPVRELKGFAKVHLNPGESKRVVIPLDDKAFRYYNTVTDRFEIESGEYEIQICSDCETVCLSCTAMVKGTGAPLPINPLWIPSYFSGNIAAVDDREFESLYGHRIPGGRWEGELTMNDAFCQLFYAQSPVARLYCRYLQGKVQDAEKRELEDPKAFSDFDRSFRSLSKTTDGAVSGKMAEGLLMIANGSYLKGTWRLFTGYCERIRNARRARKRF